MNCITSSHWPSRMSCLVKVIKTNFRQLDLLFRKLLKAIGSISFSKEGRFRVLLAFFSPSTSQIWTTFCLSYIKLPLTICLSTTLSSFHTYCRMSVVIPEEEHIIREESINDTALLFQSQHADVQLPGVQEVQDQLDHLGLFDVDDLLCCHGCRWVEDDSS